MTDTADRMVKAVNRLLNQFLVRGADGLERPMPYNPVDYQTLRYLAGAPASRAVDVGGHIGVSPTTMQSALDRLVRRGLLEKARSAEDGRARLYSLTESGMRVHAAIESQDRVNMTAMLAPLSVKERGVLVGLIERLGR